MVLGIGIDIIEVERVRKLVEKNPRFLQRIFTTQEINYCQKKRNKHQHLAARFSAKEAFFKAIGRRISWTDIELINLPSGKPQLKIKSKEKFPFKKIHVSISHLAEYAVAMVILEGEK
ncbi:MAG: holo-ACP synthase [Candidatus Aminicenantes bacterium]|nr:holo-ACP synthase [Candidatus Aminicenantes bacterium]MBL7083169.1 holo-ACP synthase [Candidatus Aminicenantes bacterium]